MPGVLQHLSPQTGRNARSSQTCPSSGNASSYSSPVVMSQPCGVVDYSAHLWGSLSLHLPPPSWAWLTSLSLHSPICCLNSARLWGSAGSPLLWASVWKMPLGSALEFLLGPHFFLLCQGWWSRAAHSSECESSCFVWVVPVVFGGGQDS